MNTKTMESRKELMFDQLEAVTGGIMNPHDYMVIKERIEKSNMAPDKKQRALRTLDGFNNSPTFKDTDTVLRLLHSRYGDF